MKSKFLILSFSSLFAMSCNSDDESPTAPEPTIPIEVRYLSKITDENDAEIMTFSYNSDKTIKTITAGSGAIQFRYEYDNGNISRIYFTIEGGTMITDFDYENGILTSFTQEGVIYAVEYIAETNSYSFVYDDNYQFSFNEHNDLLKILQDSEEENFEINLFYEPNFGSLNNINSILLQTLLATEFYFYFYMQGFNLSYQPLEDLIAPTQSVNYVNSYDELNGLTQSEITSIIEGEGTTTTYNYLYVQL